jgi:hypothetical protein
MGRWRLAPGVHAPPDIGQAGYIQGAAQQGRPSFLKKRSKKLLLVGIPGGFRIWPPMPTGKSFLLLFFKK